MRSFQHRSSGFTILEVLGALLIIVIGVTASVGLFQLGLKRNMATVSAALALRTAETALVDRQPYGLVADLSDANGDGWTTEVTAGKTVDSGFLNGFWVRRTEDPGTAIDASAQWAMVTVEVFQGSSGGLVAGLSRRMLKTRSY